MELCTAKRTTPCKAHAIHGGHVCRVHGGAAPQVVAAAKLRLALAADAVAERLVTIALSKRTRDSDVIAAAKDLLDRAGVRAEKPANERVNDGTVLWEEFIAVHRRGIAAPAAGASATASIDGATLETIDAGKTDAAPSAQPAAGRRPTLQIE
jgi:hypothetical protein